MSKGILTPSPQLLPALSPELVVSGNVARGFRVIRMSSPLERLMDHPGSDRLDLLWPQAVPSLAALAEETATTGRTLLDIPLRLRPGLPGLLVTVEPGGVSEDYQEQIVTFRLRLETLPAKKSDESGLIGESPAIFELRRKVRLYAGVDASVVVTGETGTGKELVAKALHALSFRRQRNFIAINCAALSEELLESELFGHEKGAFTGAVRTHRGRFERADGGTLFLDEVGEMPLHTQAKLLRVLEEGLVERVGGEREHPVDVRLVAATNVPLEEAVGKGRFRSDLYHRLSVLRLHLPPLRERLEDLPLLAEVFLHQFNRKYRRDIQRLTPDAIDLLRTYLWPGNVRELRNVLERVYIENQAEAIGARAFGEWVRERSRFSPGGWEPERRSAIATPYPTVIAAPKSRSTRPADLDGDEIRRALSAAQGNLSGAARLLGVHRATLYRYLKRLNLSPHELRP